MDALAMYALTLFAGLVLLVATPFLHGPRTGIAWLSTGLVGGWVLLHSVGKVPLEDFLLSAICVLQLMIGLGLIIRRLPSLVYGCLAVYAAVFGWYFARLYAVDRWLSLVGSFLSLAWMIGWKRRFVVKESE
jgi:hypothetical protein